MKIITLIAFFLLITIVFSKVTQRKKLLSRTVNPERVALELEFAGSCQDFASQVLDTVRVSSHVGCLPIQFNANENADNNNLNTDYFCSNIDENRSLIHFVEIFSGAIETVPFPNFVLSLIPSSPFRVLTPGVSLSRLPDCSITVDYCDATHSIVNGCSSNPVVYRRRREHGSENWVVSHDRIYITAPSLASTDCRTAASACCAYVAPTTVGGICDRVASRDLLEFPTRRTNQNGYGRPNHDNDHHDNDGYGRPNQDNDRHDNDHHDNDGYGRPQEHHESNGYGHEDEGRPWDHNDKKNVVEVAEKKNVVEVQKKSL